ncbi:MAG: DUF2064 domain-containing protein [Emcibacter sp.]|nr:DUF2064 domain-containing protein [Emcibacter sp.]
MPEQVLKAPCLVLFCKRPALHQGKQRLAATIGAEQAHVFARALLDCALEDLQSWPGPVVLSPATAEDGPWASTLLARPHQVIPQPEGGLGDRLWTVDRDLRATGLNRIIFMGSDAPMLTPDHFDAARKALTDSDVILSPALDGGVTLMGTDKGWPDMTDLPWSTEKLGAELEKLCGERGDQVKHIMPSYDIDVEADLLRLYQDLSCDLRPARQNLYGLLDVFLNREGTKYG